MNKLRDFLKKQTIDSINWTNKLIENIDDQKWFLTPDVIHTNLAWQIGHLTLSQYYYLTVLLFGPNKIIADTLNVKMFSELFAKGNEIDILHNKIDVNKLKNKWKYIENQTLNNFDNISDLELSDDIFQLPKPHPFVKTKEEAISWHIKHNMWHCGQIATLIRVIDKPINMGF